mgnify:CR=1 FL=1
MRPRKAQVNFMVDARLKALYEHGKRLGHRVSRYCAAGLLLLLEDAKVRDHAMQRLVQWEDGAHPTLPSTSGALKGLTQHEAAARARTDASSTASGRL